MFNTDTGAVTGQKQAKMAKISIFVNLITVIQIFLANPTTSSQN